MRKRRFVIVICLIVVGVFVALIVLLGKSQPLASFSYMGTITNSAGRFGRFSISNCSDGPIHYIPSLVEFSTNGTLLRAPTPGVGRMDLPSHQVETFQMSLPAGVNRWHGLVNVGQEKKGLASLPLRIQWTAHYGFKYAMTNGILFGDRIHDGGLVATPEVED